MQVVKREPGAAYIDTWLWVPKTFINVDGVKNSLSHTIQDYAGNQKTMTLFREAPHHLLVPRAFYRPEQLTVPVYDCTPRSYERFDFTSKIKLDHRIQRGPDGKPALLPTGDDVQQLSFNAMMNAPGGVLQLACGKGKTATSLHVIAAQKVPAIVLVDNGQLLQQWLQEVEALLDVPGGVGVIAQGQKDWKKGLVLATYQSVANWAPTMPEEVRRWFGAVYWDEGHHVSAPMFSRTAPLFYGKRYALTATPERDDGFHIIADIHIGPVLHKDLSQPLKANIVFSHTGLQLDVNDPSCDVLDRQRELHLSKVFSYYGRWRTRLNRVLQDCHDAVNAGRNVLVLCNGVDEVVNLMCLWTHGDKAQLISDMAFPTPAEVDEPGAAFNPLTPDGAKGLETRLQRQLQMVCLCSLKAKSMRDQTYQKALSFYYTLKSEWEAYLVYRKMERLHEKRRKTFINMLVNTPSTAGFMVYGVPAKVRQEFVKKRRVTFAIMKYGREGLDAPNLDTVVVSSVFSSKPTLQQVMGRITGRPSPNKKSCVLLIYRDDVGPLIGMCKKLERHLRSWAPEEGGPLDFEHVGNPRIRQPKYKNLVEVFNE